MRVGLVVVAVLGFFVSSIPVSAKEPVQVVPREAAINKEVAQANEILRLERLMSEKNRALDISIKEIKRLQSKHPVLADNPFIAAAYDATGWEKVLLEGLTGVSIKELGADTIVRVPTSNRTTAMSLMASRSRAIITCNKMLCFVLPTAQLVSEQAAIN